MQRLTANGFVAGGRRYLLRSPEFQRLRAEKQAEVQARFAPRLAASSGFARLRLQWEMHVETLRVLRKLAPSPHACFLGG